GQERDVAVKAHGARAGAPAPRGSGNQLIAAAFRDQEHRRRRLALDLLAEAVDVRFERVSRHTRIVTPDFMEEGVTIHNFLTCPIKIFEDSGLFLGEADLLPATVDQHFGAWPEGVAAQRG